MNIRELLDHAARRFAERPAYHYRKKDGAWLGIRYGEFRDRLRVVSEIIGLLGVKPHSGAVAILLDNSPEWLETFAGASYCGVAAMPLDPSLGSDHIKHALREVEAPVIFAKESLRTVLESILPDLPAVRAVVFAGDDANPAPCAGRKTFSYDELQERLYLQARIGDAFAMENWPADGDIAAIMHGCDESGAFASEALSHESLRMMASKIGPGSPHFGSSDRFLALVPFSNASSIVMNFVLPLASGACIQFPDNAKEIGADIRLLMPTVIVGSAPFLGKLLAAIQESNPSPSGALRTIGLGALAKKRALSSVGGHLRLLLCQGAECPPQTIDAFERYGIEVAHCAIETTTGASSFETELATTTFTIPPSPRKQDN